MNWGIVGTGYIADRFVDSMQHVDGARAAAVVSRSMERGSAFAQKFGIEQIYLSCDELARDPAIDIVYIGTPNSEHFACVKMFLEAGCNVLCEKPMCVNPRETEELIRIAKENNVFLMEGMWTRFFPAVRQAKAWLQEGAIGTPRMLSANFCIDSSYNLNQWRFDHSMAGGSLMDVGIYVLAIAMLMFGTDPEEVYGAARVENGVDLYNAITLRYSDGRIALLGSGLGAKMDNKVVISGSKGCIILGEGYDWWRANRAELILTGDDDFICNGERTVFEQIYPSIGFQYEIQAVEACIAAGKKESDDIPLAETLKLSRIMEKLLADWGIVYRDAFSASEEAK